MILRPARAVVSAAVALGLLAAAPPAAAAPALERAPTDGVERVYKDYSSEGDASSLELNPALLPSVRGLDLTVLGYDTVGRFARGRGFGFFGAAGLPMGLGLGLGVQVVDPGFADGTFDYAADNNPNFTKYTFGLAGGRPEFGTFGFNVHGIRTADGWIQRPDFDIGLVSRAFNFASIGATARLSPIDLRSDVLPSEFSVVAEVSVRPLGTHHVELAGGVRSQVYAADPGERLEAVGFEGLTPRGRISLRYQGLAIRGEVEQVRTTVLEDGTLAPLRQEKAVRGSVSLEGSWDFVSVGGGVHAGVSDGIDGYGIHARFHSARRGRVYWARHVDVERLDLSAIDDQRSLIGTLQRLERAKEAGKRTVIMIDARGADAGWASLHELRDALIEVRNAGGHVFSYVENAGIKDYYVASVAQRVFIHPAGALETYGIASRGLYFKDALAKIGVKAEVVKIKEYKSAGERFDRNEPSDADAAQRTEILRDTYQQVVYDVAQGRGMTTAAVRAVFDDAPRGPDQALADGLVDQVVHRDELESEISDIVGAEVEFKEFHDTSPETEVWAKAPYIGVVLVDDAIVDGSSRTIPFLDIHYSGADTIAAKLRQLREDPFCKGIVLRVDSPGGSALASDIIWREVSRTHTAFGRDPKSSPPIVVSMGNVAASGGYYVAMGTDTILADPMTITGSIGVISIHFDVSGLLAKLGISAHTFKQGQNPDLNSPFSPYTEDQRARVEGSIARTYDLFTRRVAEARGMDQAKVDELGRGHVYTGVDAKAIGLVDELGGLYDAIDLLRSKAGIAKFRKLDIRVVPREFRLLDLILRPESDDPFARQGAVRKIADRRRSRAQAQSLRNALPLVLNEALSRLPLSLLYVPQNRAQTLAPWVLD